MNSPVKLESDFVPFKLATDVVAERHRLTRRTERRPRPSRRRCRSVTCRKDVLVIGDRVCRFREGQTPVFSDPEPLTSLEVRYERAYGGVDIYSDPKLSAPYRGIRWGGASSIANTKRAVDGLELPNLEDPNDRLTPERLCMGHFMHWERQPMPQGLGWFPKHWRPRALLAGVMPADRAIRAARCGSAYAPSFRRLSARCTRQTELPDMDFRFFNGASPGLVLPFLSGTRMDPPDEPDSRRSDCRFQLPGDRPQIGLDIGEGVQEPATSSFTP